MPSPRSRYIRNETRGQSFERMFNDLELFVIAVKLLRDGHAYVQTGKDARVWANDLLSTFFQVYYKGPYT